MIQIGAPSATLDAPVEHLMACHRRIEQRLDTLVSAASHLENDRDHALEAIAKAMQFLDSNGVMHTQDEEASLFPRLRSKMTADDLKFVEDLERQHSEAEAIYCELKGLASQDSVERYRDCATRLRALYRQHIQSEDEVLAPLARRLLSEADLAAIASEMRARRGGGL